MIIIIHIIAHAPLCSYCNSFSYLFTLDLMIMWLINTTHIIPCHFFQDHSQDYSPQMHHTLRGKLS